MGDEGEKEIRFSSALPALHSNVEGFEAVTILKETYLRISELNTVSLLESVNIYSCKAKLVCG